MADYLNKKAGNYTIIDKLGDGGFATVYLAQHSVLAKKAAVKFLLEDWVEEPDVVARFFDEARTMERLHEHPNIVKILDIATKEKCKSEGLPPYFIMEYIDGFSLEDLMKADESFTLDDVVEIMSCALSALQHCHDLGVVHRDIKPSNILITKDGEVRLTDFGIAKARVNTSKTGEGLTLGSTDYMSPEQALGKRDLDYRSDIYSLGVTLYQMVCDRLPFEGDSPNAVALKHIQETPLAPVQINEAVPPKLNNIILKAIEKEKEHRYQSCDEMLEALKNLDSDEEVVAEIPSVDLSEIDHEEIDENYIAELDEATSTHTASQYAKKPPQSLINTIRIVLIVLAFTGVFLGLFKGYYFFTQGQIEMITHPKGAKIFLNGENIASSPAKLTLPPMGYLISFSKEGYATSTHYFNLGARQHLNIDKKLLLINPDFSDFNKAFADLKTQIQQMPSQNYKTKNGRDKYHKAAARLDKVWDKVFASLKDNIFYPEMNLKLIDFCQKTGCLEKLGGFYKNIARSNHSVEAYTLAGVVEEKLENPKEALKLYMEAWTRDKNYRFLLNSLGDFFMAKNENEKAKQYYEMSLFLYPNQNEIKEKLSSL